MGSKKPRWTWLTLEASKPGVFLGACAEYCGLSHANMRFRVIAEPMAKWKAWLATISGPPAQSSDPKTTDVGKLLTNTYACTNCHSFDNPRLPGNYGPNLTHLASRSTFAGGSLKVNRKNLTHWIMNAPGLIPMESKGCRLPPGKGVCNGMPSFTKDTPHGQKTMTPEDANTIVTFLLGEK